VQRRLAAVISRLLLALAGVLVGWMVVEGVARGLFGPPVALEERMLFVGPHHWRVEDDGTVRYEPHQRIRHVSFYGSHVEYDVTFATNNLGFVDSEDYPIASRAPEEVRWALVGDSFTAGYHGGEPWVEGLRERARDAGRHVTLYNLGVGGAGPPQFQRLLRRFGSELDLDRVAVLFISDDLFRPLWYQLVRRGRIYHCPNDRSRADCLRETPPLFVVPALDTPTDRLLATARAKGALSPPASPGEWLARRTRIGALVADDRPAAARGAALRMPPGFPVWLAGLREEFGTLEPLLIQLPERDEVERARHRVDARSAVERAGLRYVSLLGACDLERSDYFPADRHPNRGGYEKLARCVGRALELD
jgi:hypothetical protein